MRGSQAQRSKSLRRGPWRERTLGEDGEAAKIDLTYSGTSDINREAVRWRLVACIIQVVPIVPRIIGTGSSRRTFSTFLFFPRLGRAQVRIRRVLPESGMRVNQLGLPIREAPRSWFTAYPELSRAPLSSCQTGESLKIGLSNVRYVYDPNSTLEPGRTAGGSTVWFLDL